MPLLLPFWFFFTMKPVFCIIYYMHYHLFLITTMAVFVVTLTFGGCPFPTVHSVNLKMTGKIKVPLFSLFSSEVPKLGKCLFAIAAYQINYLTTLVPCLIYWIFSLVVMCFVELYLRWAMLPGSQLPLERVSRAHYSIAWGLTSILSNASSPKLV